MHRSPQVAVVDDDAAIREALAGLISSIGLRCQLFASAEDFLERADREGIDCMIVDVRMPGLDGLQLQERLNRAGGRPPILFMTSYCDEPTRRRALAGGAHSVLGKPVDDEELIARLQDALGGRRAQPTA